LDESILLDARALVITINSSSYEENRYHDMVAQTYRDNFLIKRLSGEIEKVGGHSLIKILDTVR
jgi:hypothetical protein